MNKQEMQEQIKLHQLMESVGEEKQHKDVPDTQREELSPRDEESAEISSED